jgi:hypothetical protein
MELTPRIRQILIYLLEAEQSATDSEVADALGVSKRTILREADYIAGILKSYGLTLVRKKGEGSLIEGDTRHGYRRSRGGRGFGLRLLGRAAADGKAYGHNQQYGQGYKVINSLFHGDSNNNIPQQQI